MRQVAVFFASWAVLNTWAGVRADESVAPVDLSPRLRVGDVTHVTAELEVGGELKFESKKPADDPQTAPISVVAKLQYAERWLADPDGETAQDPLVSGPQRTARHYEQAEAVIKIAKGGQEPQLPDDRRLVIVDATGGRAKFYSPAGPLERSQLDLLDLPGNSTLIDAILPGKTLDGDTWKPTPETMAAVLGLDSVAVCEVECVVEQVNAKFVQFRLAGPVHGTVDGATTEMELRGVGLFDRGQRRTSRFNLALREDRSIGDATAGLDVVAKLRLKIDPLDKPPAALSDDALSALPPASELSAEIVRYEAKQQGFRVVHDRKWFVISEERESVTLRRVKDDVLVAHCMLTKLPKKTAGRQTKLAEFQKDIRFSLGKHFGEFVRAREWTNDHGHQCQAVVVRGKVEEVPIEWHYFLVSPEFGHRVSVAVTIEQDMAERLGDADQKLVNQLELLNATNRQPGEPASDQDTAGRQPAGQRR